MWCCLFFLWASTTYPGLNAHHARFCWLCSQGFAKKFYYFQAFRVKQGIFSWEAGSNHVNTDIAPKTLKETLEAVIPVKQNQLRRLVN